MSPTAPRELRLLTYLSPGIPLGLFQAIAGLLAESLGCATRLASEERYSAPPPGEPDPFALGAADIGFVCAPGYVWLADRRPPSAVLVRAAPCFDDPRAAGRPVYFSELVVRAGSSARSLRDLVGGTWVYNDRCSLSGYFAVLAELERIGAGPDFFRASVEEGSHRQTLEMVADGRADCAAIDANVLADDRRRGLDPTEGVRVLAPLGPHPVQPLILRAGLAELEPRLSAALIDASGSPRWQAALARFGVRAFAPVTEDDYRPTRRMLERCEALVPCRSGERAAPVGS